LVPQLLAHAGPGSTWQAMVTVVALGLAVVVVLVALGRVELDAPGDLILPLAAVAILSSLAPLGDRWLSDWVGWAFPVGAVSLLVLLLAAFTPLGLAPDGVLLYAALGLAVAGAVVLYRPLTVAWHPPPDYLPEAGGTSIVILEPPDGAELGEGEVSVEVEVAAGSIGAGGIPFDDLPADQAEAGTLEVTVAGERVEVELDQECTRRAPCEQASFPVELPAGGEVAIRVEFLRGDGMPFSPAVSDRVELVVG
jgi:hypothetical protein